MAMTKAEMENHAREYRSLVAIARSAQQEGAYRRAVQYAVSSWKFIDGMMQYDRKYEERAFASVEGIDIVLRCAPFIFDSDSLDDLGSLLKSQRRIEKHTSTDLADELSEARALMWKAHRLWNHLEQRAEVMQDELRQYLGGDQDQWRFIAEVWDAVGLVRRIPEGRSYRLSICTRLDELARAKCPSCGAIGKGRKSRLLETSNCPKCRAAVDFVILAQVS
jgi:hypothetical protein